MRKGMKHFLAFALAFVMVLSCVPTMAFAEETTDTITVYFDNSTAQWEVIWAYYGPAGDWAEGTKGEGNLWSFTISAGATEIDFRNGNSGNETAQTETFTVEADKTYTYYPVLPTATVTEITNEDLTFALNFLADEATEEQLAYYGDWYADFVLTINKDVTFNASSEEADGYLSGQYDAWSENWVNVPFEDTTLAANTPLKIMEYAITSQGYTNKLTYGDVVEGVKNFNCGVYFTPAFLEENPDLEVTLELRMYNPANESESYVIGNTYGFEVEPEAPALPTATVTEIENEELTFAMNFQADEVTEEQLAYYANWYADFELTINKDVTFNANGSADGYLSGQYDAWSENWVDVPFENTTLSANAPLKIMEYASKMMNKEGLKLTYKDVYNAVKDFDCGVYFTPEFLAANPDLEVTLELRMYNPEDESESHAIGESYVFTVDPPALPTATVTEIENENLTFALNFLADEVTEEQLAYYGNWYADFVLTINKDVTFNANGSADGYLSGQYDAWSENWVNVPFENTTLAANTPLKIMEYAITSLGYTNKLTYGDVVEGVKNFNCGVYFTPEFLEEYPDLEVTLELRMYNPEDETESYTVGKTYEFEVETGTPELPTATVTEIANEELTIAMNFQADEVSSAQLAYYGDWYADFELTINKDVTFNAYGSADGYLSGQYDAWSENWVNVPFEDVKLKAGESLKIMEYASKLMGKPGLKYTYAEVYGAVKDFDCGVYFTPEFLAANPDLEVTLELRMYNPENEIESYTIGETYTFKNDYVAYNENTKTLYTDVSDAMLEAAAEETVILLKDAKDTIVYVLEGTTLDLNGKTLEADYVTCFGDLIDDSDENAGVLKVSDKRFMIREDNAQLPIKSDEGYQFVEVKDFNAAILDDGTKYAFQPLFEEYAHALLLEGAEASGVTINVRVSWKQNDGMRYQDFVYGDEKVAKVVNSYNAETGKYDQMYTLTLKGTEAFEDLTFTAVVVSDTGVESAAE